MLGLLKGFANVPLQHVVPSRRTSRLWRGILVQGSPLRVFFSSFSSSFLRVHRLFGVSGDGSHDVWGQVEETPHHFLADPCANI